MSSPSMKEILSFLLVTIFVHYLWEVLQRLCNFFFDVKKSLITFSNVFLLFWCCNDILTKQHEWHFNVEE